VGKERKMNTLVHGVTGIAKLLEPPASERRPVIMRDGSVGSGPDWEAQFFAISNQETIEEATEGLVRAKEFERDSGSFGVLTGVLGGIGTMLFLRSRPAERRYFGRARRRLVDFY
jgi:hypothetical protein